MAVSTNQLYSPTPPTVEPKSEDARNIADWVMRQLQIISESLSAISRLQLAPVAAPPSRPRSGLVAVSDGVNWLPLRAVQPPDFPGGALVTYRNGTWVQSDLGTQWVATDLGWLSGKSNNSGMPALDMVNNTNDINSAGILTGKNRAGASPNSGDNLFVITNYGLVSGVDQPSTAIQMKTVGAPVGNNIPSNIVLYTSDTAGQLDHAFTFDNNGSFTLTGNLVAGGFLVANLGAAIGIVDNYTGTSGGISTTVPFHTFTPSGVFTATLSAANSLAPGLLQFFQNRTTNAINSASSNVKPIGSNTAGTAILPGTIGAWCILVNDPSTNTWLTVARGT